MSLSRNTGPLTARSVVASVLLGTDPPRLPTPLLVRTTALFGISDGATRTALSRLVSNGEAISEHGGYRLVGRLAARQERQAASRRADTRRWDHTWVLATLTGDAARSPADRATLREALTSLRLAELREGVWARPDNLMLDHAPESMALALHWCTWWRGAAPDDALNVADLWDLVGWATTARALQDEMAELIDGLEAGDQVGLRDGFVTSAAVLRHLQADPLLPRPLVPTDWPGHALRADYDRYDRAYRAVLRAWFASAS